ncbi:hypothetical protein ACROYT_G003561 [Oculina patagonica]
MTSQVVQGPSSRWINLKQIRQGSGFHFYRKFASKDEEEENSATESATEEDNVPTMEDLSDVSKDDSTGFSNETQIEILVNADTSGPENGVEKQQDNVETENPATEKIDRSKKSNFGGLRKGFLL